MTACIDTCVAFGASPSCGTYRQVANAGAEILQAKGIGPLDKWIDDHLFFHIPKSQLQQYNEARAEWHSDIMLTGPKHTASRVWYSGIEHMDGSSEEFNESCVFPIQDLADRSPRLKEDALFTYNFTDINEISRDLGIPWETSKDQPFVTSTIYIGFVWDLEQQTVTLTPSKIDKYINEIDEWLARPTHTLKHVQKLYGKLLHAASILPQGRAYLLGLEGMLATCAKRPFVPHRPDNKLDKDLIWWTEKLRSGTLVRSIFPPPSFLDPRAFSDASSSFGIGITIGNRWRTWRLPVGWQSLHGPKDIGWAEAIAFELLIRTLDIVIPSAHHVLLHGDNTGIVEGWRIGRHRNRAVNAIFKHIHTFLSSAVHIRSVATRYVPSSDNPADESSRGLYGDGNLLLPAIPLPEHLRGFLIDATDPLSARELRELREGKYSTRATRTLNKQRAQQEAGKRTRAQIQLEDKLVLSVLEDDQL